MSKVICDVCGTAFPETDSHCPICGCAKSPLAQPVAEETSQFDMEKPATATSTKGGRFAKEPAKRREPAFAAKKASMRRPKDDEEDDAPQQSNKGLVAVVIILLVAIVAVVAYIGVTVFFGDFTSRPEETTPSTLATEESTEPTEETIPCTSLNLGSLMVELKSESEQYLLEARIEPADTTDEVVFTSADPTVAMVDQNGLILPVGHGQTVITVTCGALSKDCTVFCSFGEPEATTEPSQPQSGAPAPDGFVLTLRWNDITISEKYPDPVSIYKEKDGVKASDIIWTVEDPSIASVKDGVVTGLRKGNTTVSAIIGDQVVTCIVRCHITAPDPTETTGISISTTDVTLYAKKSFYLTLTNANGSKVQGIEWKASEEGLVEIDGNNITALDITAKKIIEVYTEHEGVKYSCTVRLYPPKTDGTTN